MHANKGDRSDANVQSDLNISEVLNANYYSEETICPVVSITFALNHN